MGNKYHEHDAFVQEMLKTYSPEQIIAALLRLNYEESLNPESYEDLSEVKIDTTGKTRLFIALGSKDGYNPGRLLDLLNKKAKTPGRKVKDIKIMDKYSFITVPLQEAEFIMRALNSKKDSKPLVEKATGSPSGSSSEGKKRGRKSEITSRKLDCSRSNFGDY